MAKHYNQAVLNSVSEHVASGAPSTAKSEANTSTSASSQK